jgi:hypothetical protein
MSVVMIIDFKDNQVEEQLYPITGQKTFHDYWEPIAQELGLTMVSQWASKGLFLDDNSEKVEQLTRELIRLRDYLRDSKKDIPEWAVHHMLEKSENLIQKMLFIQENIEKIQSISIV